MRSCVIEGFQPPVANGTHIRTLTVELLTGETIQFCTEGKTTCIAVWNRVQGELVARGVIHPQIFGLAIKTGFDWVFVDPDAKVSKYFAKDWKSTAVGSSSSINETKGLVFYCRVHFYLESLPSNFDSVSLHHYYLQIQQNLTSTIRRCSTNLLHPLAYALQSDVGDWSPCQDNPANFLSLVGDLPGVSIGNLQKGHRALAGLSQGAARSAFIRSLTPTYNMHVYGMTLRTKDGKDAQAWIGVTPKGIEVYQTEPGRNELPEQPRITFLWAGGPVQLFLWANITKLYFERKKFEIRGRACTCNGSLSTEKLSFTSWSESLPRHLLLLCRSTHQFHLTNFRFSQTHTSSTPNSATTEGNLAKNDDKMFDLSLWAEGLLLPNSNVMTDHQRVSVISNASSNTTSGIVSDRVYSLDGSEEDLELRNSEGTNNSTSLESLTHKTSKRHHHSLKPHHPDGIRPGAIGRAQQGGAVAKYWYCDSDCEDDCCYTSRPCRSALVRTIDDAGEKHACAAFCECNSCLADEDDSSSEDSSENRPLGDHHHTPSLASEKTLKAIDISLEAETKMEDLKQEEHVYGEICEDPKQCKAEMHQDENQSGFNDFPPKPKPRSVSKEVMMNHKNKEKSGNSVASKETSRLTPKVASLKYLRTQRVSPLTNEMKHSKNDYRSSMGSLDETSDGCYVEFDKQLQQGRYPSTRTVSDNFDTDSDYVQLPPLHPRRPPPPKRPTTCRLWKFVKISTHHKSCGSVDVVDCKSPTTTTLPRRNLLDTHMLEIQQNLEKLEVVSKSTTALNTLDMAPEPPPKPKKLSPASEFRTPTKPVEARFIKAKPQILVQTAYATPTTAGVPGQAQVLYRTSQVPQRRTQSQIVEPTLTHSLSLDNVYDTVASEETVSKTRNGPNGKKALPLPPLPPKPSSSSSSIIIRPNNYIDVHASSPARNNSNQIQRSNLRAKPDFITSKQRQRPPPPVQVPITGKNRAGSVPNNLHTFYVGLQNLKPLSRAPIVYPTVSGTGPAQHVGTMAPLIQQFKAQLYSDMDYVVFPPKDPRLSQQEYSDSKGSSSSPMLNSSLNDIPPPYLPPPPPYPFDPPDSKSKKPPRPLPATPQHSYTSLYTAAMSSNLSQCSSSQYGGPTYGMGTPSTIGSVSTVGLNAENLQKYLSTQSLSGSHHHLASPPLQIYYPASTHSAPPLPPYQSTNQVLIENGMRQAVQRLMAKNSLSSSDNRIRMKLLSRSEESLYSQPVEETEEKLQAIYNLPPPPPYNKKPSTGPSPKSEVDLTTIRQRCTALELPLLKALLNSSDGGLVTSPTPSQQKPAGSIVQDMAGCLPPARPPKPMKLRQQ